MQTPTDSFHHYFINPGGRYGNSPGGLPEGIDVRGGGRDSGGYVLAAGSVLDRRAYEGNPEMQAIVGDRKAYRVYNDAKIMEPPGWLIALLDAPRPARKGRRGGGEIGDGRNVVHRPVWAVKVEPAGQLNARIEGALRLLSDEGPGSENRNQPVLLGLQDHRPGSRGRAHGPGRRRGRPDGRDGGQQVHPRP